MHVDWYGFGALVADGLEFHTDVLITPSEVQGHWWRREGHVLRLEDLGALLDRHLERLVVGTGAYGRMRPAAGLEQELAARGAAVEVLSTAAAVDRINDLLRQGAAGWAVYQNGIWKVGDASFCALLALENGGKAPSVCSSAG